MVSTKVLVTGAGGFIGSFVVEQLLASGHTVRALTRYTSGNGIGNLELLPQTLDKSIAHNLEIFPADLRDAEAVSKAVEGVDTIFHLGALISIPYSYKHPEETIAVNITGTVNVLQAMRQHNTRRGIIVSTSEVYGTAKYVPIDESHPLQPQSPYAASKISAEALSISFHRSYDVPIVVVRPFNTYGPRQTARAVIPTIIMQALTKPVVSLGSIHTLRDYTYATDTARGLILAACSDAAIGQIVNLGTGQSTTIGDIAQKIISLIGRPVTIAANDSERLRPEKSEVLRLESDNRLAAQLIGWTPQISLEDGLLQTINWIREHLDQYNPEEYTI